MKFDFSHNTLFLTGGGGGIGSAIKESFLKSGATVISPSSTEMNLLDKDSIVNYIETLQDYPDIIIHCAGINKLAGICDASAVLIEDVFQVNLFSFIQIMKKFIPKMRANKFGRIIGISSLYGIVSKEGRIPYSSSKHAMTGLIKSVALEVAKDNILINAVAPGYVMTEMTRKNLSDEEIDSLINAIPTHRMQEAQEIADLCMFLCSSGNRSITGQVIPVDGGFLCK